MPLPFRRSPLNPGTHFARLSPASGWSEASEPSLVARFTAGDSDAFEVLFKRYYGELCAFASQTMWSSDAAEDVVQETFLYAWKHRADLGIERSFRAYLYASVRHAAISHQRHERVVDRSVGAVVELFNRSPAVPDRILALADATAELQRAISRLPERRRVIFVMRRDQGMSYQEIADALGISPKTVDVQMGRALKSLRRSLGPNWP